MTQRLGGSPRPCVRGWDARRVLMLALAPSRVHADPRPHSGRDRRCWGLCVS